MKSKTDLEPLDEREIVALAMNEQGYLFQHKLLDSLQTPQKKEPAHEWSVEATELPVSMSDGQETRIDIVLRHKRCWRAVIECKRSARDYKRWVFLAIPLQTASILNKRNSLALITGSTFMNLQ